MCGILGLFRRHGRTDEARFLKALRSLEHRGPDGEGWLTFVGDSGELALGHRRLSIIDLSPAGHQPMSSADGRYWIAFNGELLNYRELRLELQALRRGFRTQTDTEVLLEAWVQWGAECLPRLEGMFAFAVLDRQQQTLTCVRDAFGIKPLYYAEDSAGFAFASEPATLWALRDHRPTMDWQRAYDYLVHGDYDSNDRTFVEGVRILRPAHLLTLDIATGTMGAQTRWWAPSLEPRAALEFAAAAEQVRAQFLHNVKIHLRSDVPVGAALSGGIDSSALVCAMRELDRDMPIHTFSFVARGTPESEERWVDIVNKKVGAVEHKVFATGDELARDLEDLIRTQGEPFGSTRIYAQYRVFQRAKEEGIIVTLDGQGADELLGGYLGYPGERVLSLVDSGDIGAAVSFANRWARLRGRSPMEPWLHLGRVVLSGTLYRAGRSVMGKGAEPDWLVAPVLREAGVVLDEPRPLRSRRGRGRRVIERMAHALESRELPALLRHGDRNSMRFSIESRVPFLTVPLAELLLGLPETYLVSPEGVTKHVFRAAMRGMVPDVILDRTDKIGFATSDDHILLTNASRVREWLRGTGEVPFIRTDALVRSFDAVVAGKARLDWQTWRWVNFAKWSEYFAAA